MDTIFTDFENRLTAAGLIDPGGVLMGFLDDDIAWNRLSPDRDLALRLFDGLSVNSLMIARPAEPYAGILDYLAKTAGGVIVPRDCETRTFLHDLPVADADDPDRIIALLRRRKSAIVPGRGVVTYGTVSLEQAFVTLSSVCFAAFVKFFSDYLAARKTGRTGRSFVRAFDQACAMLPAPSPFKGPLAQGPFTAEAQVLAAMDEAGKQTVERRLVDSYFGNISYRLGDVLYISQTGSSLDRLPGCVDPCPLDGSSCAALTASSELSAHLGILSSTGHRAILHGHPRFAVILSMDCEIKDCTPGDACYRTCPHPRSVSGIPIVPGEVGTGPFGLCNTVPPALSGKDGVIVYGHGLFCTAENDFNQALAHLTAIENTCRELYFKRL
ncbi:class II aldolase/adducin family protein [Desulfatiferula olefinivorans]